jgi:hypothetical protein
MTVPTLSCTAQVAHLGTATCWVSAPPEEDPTFAITDWVFRSDDGTVVVQASPPYETVWDGKMVVSGTVEVQGVYLGGMLWQSDYITVTRRSWSWSGSIGGQQASPGVIDACVGTSAGLTTGQSCTAVQRTVLFTPAASGGYSTATVNDDGPNDGVIYVTNPTVTMQLRSQINKKWRSDGSTQGLPMTGHSTVVNACGPQQRNHHYVNTVCALDADFTGWVNYIWSHEDLHRAEALLAGAQPQGNLHVLWEPLVSNYQNSLTTQINSKRTAANEFINDESICSHTGTNPPGYFFWLNQGSGWGNTLGLTGDESKPGYC